MKSLDKNARKIVRKYLQEGLSKFGYIVKQHTGDAITINLNTFTINGQPDILRLAYVAGNMHYVDSRSGKNILIVDDSNRIGRLEDPEFTSKVSSFVKSMHRAKLKERMILYQKQLEIVKDEIDLIDNPE